MIHATKGIVLKTTKYGETSVIATIFTELFGVQTYMVNGVRTSGKTAKAHFFQAASILDMQVYHNELKNLQRIKELKWSVVYNHILSDVIKNSVAVYMIEVLQKTLKQPETNTDLFQFCEDSFLLLDNADEEITANFPIYFSLHLAPFLGIGLQDNYSANRTIFNIEEGLFIHKDQTTAGYMSAELSYDLSQLLKAIHPSHLREIKLNKNSRREILHGLEKYYSWHIPDFGSMKTLAILSAILS